MFYNRILDNPFGQTWIEDLRKLLPTIKAMDITEENLLIDGNRRFLIVWGHGTNGSIWQTKIIGEGSSLRITTTAMVPHIIINLIGPIIFIIMMWVSNFPIYMSVIATVIFSIGPIGIISSLRREEVFNDLLKGELERIGGN